MLGSIAEGVTEATGFLEGQDALCTVNAFRAMGVTIEGPSNGQIRIQGVGLDGLKAPEQALDMGNSGTSIRLISGLLAAQPFDATMTGDASLTKRPMARVITPLQQMGAVIDSDNERPPLTVRGGQSLKGIHYVMPMASAQVNPAYDWRGCMLRVEHRSLNRHPHAITPSACCVDLVTRWIPKMKSSASAAVASS